MISDHLLLWGIVVHLICDWILQDEWQAINKVSLKGPAAYVHAGIHLCGLLLVFSPPYAFGLAVTHLLVDTRRPLVWWRKFYRQTTEGPMASHVAIWGDQVLHVSLIAGAALLQGRG